MFKRASVRSWIVAESDLVGAIGFEPTTPTIKREHITWAWNYVNGSIKDFAQKLDKDLSENPFQKQTAKALDLIMNAKNYSNDRKFAKFCRRGLMPRGKLTKLLKMKSREVDEVIIYLGETGQISHCMDSGVKCFSIL